MDLPFTLCTVSGLKMSQRWFGAVFTAHLGAATITSSHTGCEDAAIEVIKQFLEEFGSGKALCDGDS